MLKGVNNVSDVETNVFADQPNRPAILVSMHALKRTLLSGSLITGFSMAEFAYVLPVASRAINPLIAYILTIITYTISILLWLRLAFVDPGRLPRSHNSYDSDSSACTPIEARSGVIFQAAGITFETSICAICGMTLPPESDHCEETDECIVALDHYCPWVGLPIGLRNMLIFVVAVFVLFLHSVWCFSLATVALIYADTLNTIVIAITCLMGSFFGGAFSGGMCGWTLYDIIQDKSPRLYTLRNLQIAKEDTRDELAYSYYCPSDLIEYVNNSIESRITWLKHTGLRRLIFGSYMPTLYHLPPKQAECQAWAWTIVLCGTSQL